jgi:hypothetical protein
MLFFTSNNNNNNGSLKDNEKTMPGSSKASVNQGVNKDSYIKKIYLNMYFLDRRETIRNIIRSKVPRNRPLIRALAKRAAVVFLEKGFVERVAGGLSKAIPERMEMMGVKVLVTTAYAKSAYACIELTFVGLDFKQFLTFNAGKDKATTIMNFIDKYSLPAINSWAERTLLGFMASKIVVNLPITMKEKLYVKMNAEVEIIACLEEDQGPYLVQTIAQLNADASNHPSGAVSGKDTTINLKENHESTDDAL